MEWQNIIFSSSLFLSLSCFMIDSGALFSYCHFSLPFPPKTDGGDKFSLCLPSLPPSRRCSLVRFALVRFPHLEIFFASLRISNFSLPPSGRCHIVFPSPSSSTFLENYLGKKSVISTLFSLRACRSPLQFFPRLAFSLFPIVASDFV